jgi:hypothetical protein
MRFAVATRAVVAGIFALMPTRSMIREIENSNDARATAQQSDKETDHRGEETLNPNHRDAAE